ncbi:hypothetical protein TELCIR_04558 [Teladorsagia circumcincta]|uniref:Reverse transcriptase RNase H-like domain-containing protein n=1 Tax=Teladorsagia circumcincta TaxID=45464 RepID=A0A2G9UVE6_TELCI|nr:hypothetical protein TELCIR_04558 [Teladorsagia circumcincta]
MELPPNLTTFWSLAGPPTNTTLDSSSFQRIQDYGFRVRFKKCSFLQTQIKYLGFVINAQGRRPDPDKVKAIQKMPAKRIPRTHQFLRKLRQGSAQSMRSVRHPHEEGCSLHVDSGVPIFHRQVKASLNSNLLLTHYNPNLPIIVAFDASDCGIGATLSHRFPDGSEKVVYHASRCLTPSQKNYSQIEKEALALIFAVQKFHRFVHGRHFTLETDHKPVVAIFGNKKGIPVYCANRLQRWATMLLNYDFAIEYVKTKDFSQVDAHSLLIASHPSTLEDYVIANLDVNVSAEFIENCRHLPVSTETIRTATKYDHVIKRVIDYTKPGKWPKIDRNSPFWHYYDRRDTLTNVEDCLLSDLEITAAPCTSVTSGSSRTNKDEDVSTKLRLLTNTG